ncbi:hypothetical protein NQ015_06950 [Corynebacterium sp. 153RC1]|uniref:hypothetical protein n=1 Tax=unclassified Corynebacterium TaxID=2624378 RepID=UPI00211B7B8C|nr:MULTISPECIES: hypothetical protein [unclassified Corynebacterium]MCQ9370839.1 hypothetical protein [Corynebacterium sp. 35RC1]MCQ9352668.1 hypothetical protein [Corynebacterium sp. 209RC1]MCQ9354852.1 hypothetical protein [Corynebacterium sp. 1222RC1]MCQ9357037.1 hypothetical protein [Corynebacterium sp. 122RC1]MCQ9359283.1 hypothetical protein [Corynebacterium sp. 142RC1]
MSQLATQSFRMLYPEIDPANGLPLTLPERMALTVAIGVLAYGGIVQDLVVLGAGVAMVMAASLMQSHQTNRRVRVEARGRFPGEQWAEHTQIARVKLPLALLAGWVLVALVVGVAWWQALSGWWAVLCALLAAGIVWFMPGVHPMWRKRLGRTSKDVGAVGAVSAAQK